MRTHGACAHWSASLHLKVCCPQRLLVLGSIMAQTPMLSIYSDVQLARACGQHSWAAKMARPTCWQRCLVLKISLHPGATLLSRLCVSYSLHSRATKVPSDGTDMITWYTAIQSCSSSAAHLLIGSDQHACLTSADMTRCCHFRGLHPLPTSERTWQVSNTSSYHACALQWVNRLMQELLSLPVGQRSAASQSVC